MNKLSFTKAKQLSIAKWQEIIKNDGIIIYHYKNPNLEYLINNCGFCELVLKCVECPFIIRDDEDIYNCDSIKHPYGQWRMASNDHDKKLYYAKFILYVIKHIKINHYRQSVNHKHLTLQDIEKLQQQFNKINK